ncbi:MAG: hypothetical protein ING19_02705 [Azospirillum sp.]|nr:hypothetical protein [Azospirillum sp.]
MRAFHDGAVLRDRSRDNLVVADNENGRRSVLDPLADKIDNRATAHVLRSDPRIDLAREAQKRTRFGDGDLDPCR